MAHEPNETYRLLDLQHILGEALVIGPANDANGERLKTDDGTTLRYARWDCFSVDAVMRDIRNKMRELPDETYGRYRPNVDIFQVLTECIAAENSSDEWQMISICVKHATELST